MFSSFSIDTPLIDFIFIAISPLIFICHIAIVDANIISPLPLFPHFFDDIARLASHYFTPFRHFFIAIAFAY
jgi:hypothetical protein